MLHLEQDLAALRKNATNMTYIIIVLLVLAGLGALIFAHKVAQKDKHNRKLKKQAKQLTTRANDVWDLTDQISNYIKAADITSSLIDYYIHLLRVREELFVHEDLEDRINEAEQFKATCQQKAVVTQLENDQEINQAKRVFAKSSKMLRAALNKKVISGQACVSMRQAMRLRMLHLEVDAYERFGDKAGDNNDPAMATNYYKFAKKLLIESDLKFDGKNQRVRDITDKNQRLFGNVIEDRLTKQVDEEADAVDEFGIPKSAKSADSQKKKI